MVGVGYTTLGQFIGYGIRFISNLILARLLAPDLFGLMAVGYTFTYAAALLSDIGLRSAIIQNSRADDPEFRNSVWMVIFIRGMLIGLFVSSLTVVLWLMQRAGAFVPQSLYADPRMLAVLPLLAFAELVKGIESIEILYRERQLDFRALFIFNTSKQIVVTVTTVIWSWLDPGVVALCSGSIMGNAFGVVISYAWLSRRLPRLVWRPDDFRYILEHGKWLLVSASLTFLMNTADRVYMAVGLDAHQLGIYSIAMTLGLLAQEFATKLSNSVVFPAISHRIRDGVTDVAADFYRMRRMFEYIALGSGFFFIALGNEVVRLMYDARYHSAGQVLRVFGVVSLLIAFAPATEAYIGMGQAKKNSIVYSVKLLSLVISLIVLVPSLGILGGAWSLVVSNFCATVAIFWCNIQLKLISWPHELRLFGKLAAGFVLIGALEYWRGSF